MPNLAETDATSMGTKTLNPAAALNPMPIETGTNHSLIMG
jgi:hypothetical protein